MRLQGHGGALLVSLALLLSCGGPVHPSDPAIPDEVCQPRCQREHDCNPTVDVESCVSHCAHALSPRIVYDRADYVTALRGCAQGQSCVANIDQSISACQSDSFRRLEPTSTARAFCKRRVERSFQCGDYRWDEDHCVNGHKAYTDAILGQLTDCLDRPCSNYARCMVAVVGRDVVWEDSDRIAEDLSTPVPQPSPVSVTVQGFVETEAAAPIAEATVCLNDLNGPCARTGPTGDFSLQIPAHSDAAITARASGFGQVVVAVSTRGKNWAAFKIVLRSDATLQARYSGIGGLHSDAGTGYVYATAQAPDGSPTGLEGVTMDVTPKPGRGPLYFAPTSDPDPQRTATSTWSSALFADVPPGEITLTFGPAAVTCVPSYGGWPSSLPSSVRVPIAAGFETRVVMRCHK
jgi:hypothetical protein